MPIITNIDVMLARRKMSSGELAKEVGVEMPITNVIYHVTRGELSAADAIEQLMGREKKHERA